MRRVAQMMLAIATLVSLSCGPKPPALLEEAPPDWIKKDSFVNKGLLYFVGMSHKYADEKSSRDDAAREARLKAVRYLETAAREDFERIVDEFGMASEVLNPSIAARGYAEWVSQGVLQKSRIVRTYVETGKTQTRREFYFQSYALLMMVPDEQVVEAFRDYSNRKKQEWGITQEQFDRVNDTFRDYWGSKKAEQEWMELR